MARTTTRRTHRAPGSQPARRTRKTPIRSQTPQRRRSPSRTSLSQRRDLIGGGLLALGAFLAVRRVPGLGRRRGRAQDRQPAAPAGGRAAVVVPPICWSSPGALIFVNSPLRHVRPLRLGAVIFCASLMLALSSDDTIRVERHGGLAGAYLRIGLEGLIGQIGVSILIALGFLAADRARHRRLGGRDDAQLGTPRRPRRRRPAPGWAARWHGAIASDPRPSPTLVAVPGSRARAVAKAARRQPGVRRHLRRRARVRPARGRAETCRSRRAPTTGCGGRGRPRRGDHGRGRRAAARAGRRAASADRLPPSLALDPQEERGQPRRRRGPQAGRPQAGRGAGQLRRRGALHRHGLRPARDALRAAARARHQGLARVTARATTWPTPWPRPRSASWRRSPASRRSASRCPTRRPTWSRWATSTASRRPAPAR